MFATLALIIGHSALSTSAAAWDEMAFLRPRAVECIGSFCHTGTVTMIGENLKFAIREPNGQPHFLLMKGHFKVALGDIVTVTGDSVRQDNGTTHKIVHDVIHLGRKSLPPPENIPIAELFRKDLLYQRVTTEGTLVLARCDEIDATTIQLLVKDGVSVLNAAFKASTNQADDVISLLGARLRLTGVLMQGSGARRNIANYLSIDPPGGFEVVTPPPADLFNAPELNFDSPCAPDELVRLPLRRFEGIVLGTWGGNRLMLAGRNYHRIEATLAKSSELPSVDEHVAVVGFPDADLYGINLIYARCKPLQTPEYPCPKQKPTDTTLRQLLTDGHGHPRINGYSHGRLLRLKGSVLDVQSSFAMFSLNADGFTLPVDCSSSPSVLSSLETNSKVEVDVLAITETDRWRENLILPQTRGLRLILRSPAGLRVLARPPWWTPARLMGAVVSLLVAIVLIVAANRIINRIMMRRKISERTRLAVELHDSLSQSLAGVACQIAAGHGAIADDPDAAKSLLSTAEKMLDSCRTELKNCLFDLRNDTVDDPDFSRAIANTISGLKPDAHIAIRFHVARSQMIDSTAHAVLCIIRELAANAIRHGGATRIRIAGTTWDGQLRFSVCDNGCGFDPKDCPGPNEGHFGLSGIRERIAGMNGTISITSARGCTRVAIGIELP